MSAFMRARKSDFRPAIPYTLHMVIRRSCSEACRSSHRFPRSCLYCGGRFAPAYAEIGSGTRVPDACVRGIAASRLLSVDDVSKRKGETRRCKNLSWCGSHYESNGNSIALIGRNATKPNFPPRRLRSRRTCLRKKHAVTYHSSGASLCYASLCLSGVFCPCCLALLYAEYLA